MVKQKLKVVLMWVLLLLTPSFFHAQDCTSFTYPTNGTGNVEVNATITWQEISGFNGYLLSIGTTPQGKEILDRKPIGNDTSYTAPTGLPDGIILYASLSIVPYDGPPILCQEISFTTLKTTTIPPCTLLITPDNNASSVTIVTDIEWRYSPTATGYYISIGTTPNGNEIVNKLDVK
ncbi:MAG: hypothetical protein ABJL43_19460, partial [Maribacter dokdonensis]